jgi:phosphoketolase
MAGLAWSRTPISRGPIVVLPILHLNGYKIANPCVLARISHEELDHLFRGYGYTRTSSKGMSRKPCMS